MTYRAKMIIAVGLLLILSCQKKETFHPHSSVEAPGNSISQQNFYVQDLQNHACDLFNQGLLAIGNGDLEMAMAFFDEAIDSLDSEEELLGRNIGIQTFYEDLVARVQLEEDQIQSDLVFEENGLDLEDSLKKELAEAFEDQELEGSFSAELIPDYEHFFFDQWEMENPRTADLIHNFTNRNAKAIRASLERSTRYLPMIKAIFKEECLPEDLCYLPLIESGFRDAARSKARAVGLWQFVSGTAQMMGLKVDWWVDERRDPEASTRAAAKYLNFLYEQYGDWYLTLVAYNAGPGRVNQAIRKGRTRDYWVLSQKKLLPRESRNYIPSFMAAVTIAKSPDDFGFSDLAYHEPFQSETVEVDFSIELKRLAQEAQMSAESLVELNPALRHQVTPGGQPAYRLKVPEGYLEKTRLAMNRIPPEERVQWKQYRIRKGDTLGRIARTFGVSVHSLKTANNISNPRHLKIGNQLIIPLGPEERVVRFSQDTSSGSYQIVKGDTLSQIAKDHSTTVQSILRLNPGLRPARLSPGTSIKIKGQSGENGPQDGNQDFWIIRSGDTLYDISRFLGTSVSKLCSLNGISKQTVLQPGQRLKLPDKLNKNVQNYAIRKGDTLSKIAQKFKVRISDLMAWNQLSPSHILQVGQRIVVYR